jgi:glycosyltransferase involved in cell wall biosynthesis
MTKHFHIISFNVPYPADYGGVIDVYYRIKALHEAGVHIHLHCFQYGREGAPALKELCDEVVYYRRSMSVLNQFSSKPFIVKSRANQQLLRNLLKDDYPILFEGLHSCYYLNHPKLKVRTKIVRCHNIEHNYYLSLAKGLKSPTLMTYFRLEAFKLKRFEEVLHYADHIAAISEADETYFQQKYGKTFFMRPSHPSSEVAIIQGKGDYVLYHGDLSTNENIESARFIIQEIAPKIAFNMIIAGKNPSSELKTVAGNSENVQLVANPSHDEMQELIANAHINLLPTFQATGFKLKLLNALFNGRFCLVTPQMVEGTGLGDACEKASEAETFCSKIEELFTTEFSAALVQKRTALLDEFSNSAVVSMLVDLL